MKHAGSAPVEMIDFEISNRGVVYASANIFNRMTTFPAAQSNLKFWNVMRSTT